MPSGLFDGHSLSRARLEAPFNELFDHHTENYFVAGRLIVEDDSRPAVVTTKSRFPCGVIRAGNCLNVLLDAFWHWGQRCPAMRQTPLWIDRSAIDTNYPR